MSIIFGGNHAPPPSHFWPVVPLCQYVMVLLISLSLRRDLSDIPTCPNSAQGRFGEGTHETRLVLSCCKNT